MARAALSAQPLWPYLPSGVRPRQNIPRVVFHGNRGSAVFPDNVEGDWHVSLVINRLSGVSPSVAETSTPQIGEQVEVTYEEQGGKKVVREIDMGFGESSG